MDLADSPAEAAYRRRVRSWLESNARHAPPDRTVVKVQDTGPFRAWQRRLYEAGFVGITWPAEHGGQGLGQAELAVFGSELIRAGVPGPFDMVGTSAVGPTIIALGTQAQQDRYLRKILRAEEFWCQLFSEPSAGSDLAAVRTSAVRRGDGWEITGRKVWTTHGHQADLGMLLARTDPDVPKHQGLTVFVVPMAAPGVIVQPLRQMSGHREFNEITLDHVELAGDAVLGEVGGGWPVALTMVAHERLHLVAGLDQMGFDIPSLVASVAQAAAGSGPVTESAAASIIADLHAVRFGGYRALSSMTRGTLPNAGAGLGKITAIDAVMRACRLMIESLGAEAFDGQWGDLLATMPCWRMGGGTPEILLNTVGERVLGLPAEARTDKNVAFRELALADAEGARAPS
ncbi:MAG TPA: acyl-CoA dehydrogenase family protein [Streptosporangiaceae bacterium]|nr:acyl-CoA dehydrogenase family protein [Streptosporangiaceae bacterium]